jgi:hypothetical protein
MNGRCPGCDDTGWIDGFYCSCAAAESLRIHDLRSMERVIEAIAEVEELPADDDQLSLAFDVERG